MKKFLILIVLVALVGVGVTFFLKSRNSDEKKISEAVLEQLNLKSTMEEESEKPESYIDLGKESLDIQACLQERLKLEVDELKDTEVVLSIENADFAANLPKTAEPEQLMELLKSEDCPIKKSKVTVSYTKEEDRYVFDKSPELLDAVYGGSMNYYGLGGTEE